MFAHQNFHTALAIGANFVPEPLVELLFLCVSGEKAASYVPGTEANREKKANQYDSSTGTGYTGSGTGTGTGTGYNSSTTGYNSSTTGYNSSTTGTGTGYTGSGTGAGTGYGSNTGYSGNNSSTAGMTTGLLPIYPCSSCTCWGEFLACITTTRD